MEDGNVVMNDLSIIDSTCLVNTTGITAMNNEVWLIVTNFSEGHDNMGTIMFSKSPIPMIQSIDLEAVSGAFERVYLHFPRLG